MTDLRRDLDHVTTLLAATASALEAVKGRLAEEPTPTPTANLLTEAEAAKVLGVSPKTLRGWRSLGRPRPMEVRCGRAVRYRMADLEAWVAGRVAIAEQAASHP